MLEHRADGGNKTLIVQGGQLSKSQKKQAYQWPGCGSCLAYELARPAGKRRRDIMLLPVAIYDRPIRCKRFIPWDYAQTAIVPMPPRPSASSHNQAHRTLFCEKPPMGRLTTHALDTAHGCPAAGLAYTLYRLDAAGAASRWPTAQFNADGRADAPLLADAALLAGVYELEFAAGIIFAAGA